MEWTGHEIYSITKGRDGKFHCQGRLQDGTEHWTEDTLEAAIKSMKDHAWYGNHTKIKKKDIAFWETVDVVVTQYKEWKP